jgi:hypothetical protein
MIHRAVSMRTGRATKLTGAVGEFLVAAELCRLNLLATPFAGNVPHYDIIASGQWGGHVAVQVKTANASNWQFDIRKFADIHLDTDGQRQIFGKLQPEPFPDLMCVLVALKQSGQDRFFVLEWKELQDILVPAYRAYLKKHGGVRPRSPRSFHTALKIEEARPFENQWRKILNRVPSVPDVDLVEAEGVSTA